MDRLYDLPVASRVYRPKSWASYGERKSAADVQTEVGFETKGEIALGLIDAGVRTRAVADGGLWRSAAAAERS